MSGARVRLSRTLATEGLLRGAGNVGQRSGRSADGQHVACRRSLSATGHLSDATTVRSATRQRATRRLGTSVKAALQQRFHMSMTEAPLTFPSTMSFPCCRAARLAVPKSENACGWLSLKTAACGGGCCHRRTTYPHRNVITFGVTGMPVKATESAGKYEGMKFVPLVEKKRVCRHGGHSAGEDPLYRGTDSVGRQRLLPELH